MRVLLPAAALAGLVGCAVKPPPPPLPPAPAPQVEVAPLRPAKPRLVWQPGGWHWSRGSYVWVRGHYVTKLASTHHKTTPKPASS